MAIQTATPKSFLNTSIVETSVAVPAVRPTPIKQVVIVLDGTHKAKRILPDALAYARRMNAELFVIRTHNAHVGTTAYDEAAHDLKSIKSKLKSQYDAVSSALYDGVNIAAALTAVVSEQQDTYLIIAEERQNRFQRLLGGNPIAALHAAMPNLSIKTVAV